ncbi:MAG TPA: iron-containing alcohol dehydrogenase [Candidatus Cloacimonas sp.]|jgi:alcohol dehydrogenase|nr:iron-containing alcohol dehydrogenase [Candidatus Cloacimonas sp.]HRR00230.1 iron-containing alcohol dehydrogenase [Candidatus Cloacimonas sp.]HRV10433.1 iron-containing alcohol dehydrogenase [Candidatus Cloacimonas sp.]
MFYCPTRIIFADDAIQKAKDKIAVLGKKALLVSGEKSAKQSGALSDLITVLNELEIHYVLFDRIKENPTLDSVMEGKQIFLQNNCDFVIGIGGGSPIDAAKAISLAAANSLNRDEIYNIAAFKNVYPIMAIPLTAGTGSEATQYSVLSDPTHKKKAGLGSDLAFPALAAIDPKYTLTLTPKVTMHTALDALSHLLEGLYSNQRSPLVYPFIYKGIASIMKCLPRALSEPDNLAARKELMQSALYGGIVIAQGSTTLQHSIGYPLTSNYNIPHGLANAMVMEDIMELYYPAISKELNDLFAYLNLSKDAFYAWLRALPFERKIELSDTFIEEAIPQVMGSRNMALNPLPVSEEHIRIIFEHIRKS